ncbi:non-hydrolyzing UDP-N-acetylglucosamine 2-epimerase [Crenothrix polyspora]|uniref:UDP-N-acetylglucosamine 2-epimerase n=1 Tax=Crenothrix polyspora TaxID=360316 RepID=A0A1R4HCR5_9GAMM|nr:UDP-N-acetylglucosamine 2-epimerase (non-hydrolyzing) [Crenothrix polyspora]SJM94028.1 UDP-N-acetylglucosamine 2-epimerase [Crenothrix polyspora]
MLKVMTIVGTRPEIIRLSLIIPLLDRYCEHKVVFTGQNYDKCLSNIFFEELQIRQPDYSLDSKADTAIQQIGNILSSCEKIILQENPDRLLLLGDTNSALTAIIAKRFGIPVFHMEAGNRCYDDRVPEEINRRIIDHTSDILLPYTLQSKINLLREGINSKNIYVIGNPIHEVLNFYQKSILDSNILHILNIKQGEYFLVSLHRAENVDINERLVKFITALHRLSKDYSIPVICSTHPRTKYQIEKQGIVYNSNHEQSDVRMLEPLGLFDFVHLEQHAKCVLTDSGTVQEECCLFNVPNVTLRDVTERPETLESGSNIISGAEIDNILNSVKIALDLNTEWKIPEEYKKNNVSQTVVKIVLGTY